MPARPALLPLLASLLLAGCAGSAAPRPQPAAASPSRPPGTLTVQLEDRLGGQYRLLRSVLLVDEELWIDQQLAPVPTLERIVPPGEHLVQVLVILDLASGPPGCSIEVRAAKAFATGPRPVTLVISMQQSGDATVPFHLRPSLQLVTSGALTEHQRAAAPDRYAHTCGPLTAAGAVCRGRMYVAKARTERDAIAIMSAEPKLDEMEHLSQLLEHLPEGAASPPEHGAELTRLASLRLLQLWSEIRSSPTWRDVEHTSGKSLSTNSACEPPEEDGLTSAAGGLPSVLSAPPAPP